MLHQTIQITESQRENKPLRPAVHAPSLSHTHKRTHTQYSISALSARLSAYTSGGSSVTSAKGISTAFPSGGCGQMD